MSLSTDLRKFAKHAAAAADAEVDTKGDRANECFVGKRGGGRR